MCLVHTPFSLFFAIALCTYMIFRSTPIFFFSLVEVTPPSHGVDNTISSTLCLVVHRELMSFCSRGSYRTRSSFSSGSWLGNSYSVRQSTPSTYLDSLYPPVLKTTPGCWIHYYSLCLSRAPCAKPTPSKGCNCSRP